VASLLTTRTDPTRSSAKKGEHVITTQAFATIRALQRSAWNDCFPGALEDWD